MEPAPAARSRRHTTARIALAVIAGVFVVAAGVLAWSWWNLGRALPGDAALRARFAAHRSTFDVLAGEVAADSALVGAGHDWMASRFGVYVRDGHGVRSLPAWEVAATGRADLERLLDQAGMRSVARAANGDIRFVALRNRSRGVGLLYSKAPPGPVVTSLDQVPPGGSGYLALGSRWYVFVEPHD